MEFLLKLYKTNPYVRCINLEHRYCPSIFSKISDFNGILPLLAKFDNLEDLELENAQFEFLPPDLSCLKNLTSLNVLGHEFQNLGELVNSLRTLPLLKKLWMTFKDKVDLDFIIETLPKLEYINDTKLADDEKPIKEDEVLAEKSRAKFVRKLDSHDLKDFDEILQLMKGTVNMTNINVDDEYRKRVSVVTEVLSNSLKNEGNSPIAKSAMMFKARYGLVDLFSALMCEVQPIEHRKIWAKIKTVQDDVVENLLRIILTMKPETEDELVMWKTRCKKAEQEMAEAVEMYQQLQGETNISIKEKESNMGTLNSERQQLLNKIAELENTNKRYLATIVKYTKGSAQGSMVGGDLSMSFLPEAKSFLNISVKP